jgi:hypothetical protein
MATPEEALRKLSSGQTLTNAEKKLLGISTVAAKPAPASAASFRRAEEADRAAVTPVAKATPATTVVNPSALAAQESGAIGAASISAQIKAATAAAAVTPIEPTPTFEKAGTFLGYDYVGQTATTGTLRRRILADGKGGQRIELTTEKNPDYVSGSRGGGSGAAGATGATGATGSGSTFTWTDPDTGQVRNFNSGDELTAFVTTWSTNKTIATNQAAKAEADRLKKEQENASKRTAQQEFRAALTELGLADLADTVDNMIRDDFTAAQIKLELPKQPAYKLRFPGMQALRDAGQAINEATYISMERGYIQTLGAYGLDAGVFGARSELGKYIANMVSPREFEERVNIAKNRVADNTDVVRQLKSYYPEVDNSAIVSYLLNPVKGIDIIKKQVRAAEIGAAATFAGFTDLGGKGEVGMGYAESLIGATGTADLAALKKDFGQAKTLSRTQSRLAGLEGQAYDDTEAVSAVIAQEQSSMLASQRRAERETKFRFGGSSGVGATSLRSTTNQ